MKKIKIVLFGLLLATFVFGYVTDVVKAQDEMADYIARERRAAATAKARISAAISNLNELPTIYSDEIAEINGYAPSGAHETLAKNRHALMVSEYQALITALQQAETCLAPITEF